MTVFTAFILGLLIGWLVEWVIDWLYWRRKGQSDQMETVTLQGKLESCQRDREALEVKVTELKTELVELKAQTPVESVPTVEIVPDKLEIIKGIGPVIARKLQDAGVKTFTQLGSLTPTMLEEIVGEEIKRLADEDEIIQQAQELAGKSQRIT
jgi:predicted flap endonuclease-1-like 5' DNA nuclease